MRRFTHLKDYTLFVSIGLPEAVIRGTRIAGANIRSNVCKLCLFLLGTSAKVSPT